MPRWSLPAFVARAGSVVAPGMRLAVLDTGQVPDTTQVARGMDFHTSAKVLGLSSARSGVPLVLVHGMAP